MMLVADAEISERSCIVMHMSCRYPASNLQPLVPGSSCVLPVEEMLHARVFADDTVMWWRSCYGPRK